MTVRVDVQLACNEGLSPDAESIRVWIERTLTAVGRTASSDVSVRIVGESEMQGLNHDFRQIDKSTNVLSFPAGEIDGLPPGTASPLGDIVLCSPVVGLESRQQGKPILDHWAHLIVHGTLHLLGFDHQSDDEAEAMENLETGILVAHNVADPYGESPRET